MMGHNLKFSVLFCGLWYLSMVNGKSVGESDCTEEELNESQRAFRNCVESSKAGIVSSHANSADEKLVCRSLENMLAGCDSQVT